MKSYILCFILFVLIVLNYCSTNLTTYLQIDVVYPSPLPDNQTLAIGGTECGLSIHKQQNLKLVSKNLYRTFVNCINNEKSVSLILFRGGYNHVEKKYFVDTKIGENIIKIQFENNSSSPSSHSYSFSPLSSYQKITIEPYFNMQTKGKLSVIKNVYSSELNNTYRDIYIYTPPLYNENTIKKMKKVIIVNDGQELYRYTYIIESLMKEGKIDNDLIFIGIPQIYFQKERYYELSFEKCDSKLCPSVCQGDFADVGGLADTYYDWVEEKLIPLIRNNGYRIANYNEGLKFGVMGTSFGAYSAVYASWTRPNKYRGCVAQSANFDWNCDSFRYKILEKIYVDDKSKLPKIYLDVGTFESLEPMKSFQMVYNKLKYWQTDVIFNVIQGGIHTFNDWSKRMGDGLIHSFPPKKYKSEIIKYYQKKN